MEIKLSAIFNQSGKHVYWSGYCRMKCNHHSMRRPVTRAQQIESWGRMHCAKIFRAEWTGEAFCRMRHNEGSLLSHFLTLGQSQYKGPGVKFLCKKGDSTILRGTTDQKRRKYNIFLCSWIRETTEVFILFRSGVMSHQQSHLMSQDILFITLYTNSSLTHRCYHLMWQHWCSHSLARSYWAGQQTEST